jgi:hypothetical protein
MRFLRRRPTVAAVGLLCGAVLLFFAAELRQPDAFVYRPGSPVSDLTITFWPNIRYIQQSLAEHGQVPLWRTLIFSGSPFDGDPQSGLWYPPNAVFLILPAEAGFNLLFAGHALAAGLGMWVWARSAGASAAAALLAAIAYAFSPRAFAHLGFGHVGLHYAAAYIPWALWAAQAVGRGAWQRAGALGLALGWQFIAHPQLAFYTVLVAVAYSLAVALGRRLSSHGGAALADPACGQPNLQDAQAANAVPDGLALEMTGPLPGSPATASASILPRSTGLVTVRAWAVAAWPGLSKTALGLVLGGVLALAVCSAQLLPALELASRSGRAQMAPEDRELSSLPTRYLWGMVLADHRGFMDYMVYAGLPVLVLALIALPQRHAIYGWYVVMGAMLYALGDGTPVYGWANGLLPAQAAGWLRAPSRAWFIAGAVLALMASLGLDRLLGGLSRRARYSLNLAMASLGLLPALLAAGLVFYFGRPAPGNLLVLAGLAPLTAAMVMAGASSRLPNRLVAGAAIVLTLADLWIVDSTLVEGRPPEAAFAESGLGAYLASQAAAGAFRVYSPSYSLPRHIAARYGLETADGVDPLYLSDYDWYVQQAAGIPRQGYGVTVPPTEGQGDVANVNRGAVPNARLLGRLNVRYIAAEFQVSAPGLREIARFGRTILYENAAYRPRAYLAGTVVSVTGLDEAMQVLGGPDENVVPVEGGPPLASGPVAADVLWRAQTPNGVELEVSLNRTGFLAISQVWYPGWQARVDGQPQRLWRANGVLAGVYLQPGRHTVRLDYRPGTLWIGLGLTAAGLAGCVVLLARRGG